MRVFVLGGTGFIGYHASLELLDRGHRVSILSLPPLPAEALFPDGVRVTLADFKRLSDEKLTGLLEGHDAALFAAGADDRTVPEAPAYPFFYRENVEQAERFVGLAANAGVSRVVFLGSYLAHFDRIWPHLHLSERHPYIRSRSEQEFRVLEAARDIRVMILELPFIFGSMPGRTPLWAPLVRLLRSPLPLFCIRGGTNMIAVRHVAEAAAGAMEKGEGGSVYLIGEKNVSWAEWIGRLGRLAGRERTVHLFPARALRPFLGAVHAFHLLRGKESGLHPVHALDFLTEELFYPSDSSRQALGYGYGGLDQAFEETARACLPIENSA